MKPLISLHSVWLLSAVDHFESCRRYALLYKAEIGRVRTGYRRFWLAARRNGTRHLRLWVEFHRGQ